MCICNIYLSEYLNLEDICPCKRGLLFLYNLILLGHKFFVFNGNGKLLSSHNEKMDSNLYRDFI